MQLGGNLNRVSSLLLIFLVLLSSGQQQSCCCLRGNTRNLVVAREHDCCNPSPSATIVKSRACLHGWNSCCGVRDSRIPVTANSLTLLQQGEESQLKRLSVSNLIALDQFTAHGLVPQVNRAPPRLQGFGSNNTYLLKRSLLI